MSGVWKPFHQIVGLDYDATVNPFVRGGLAKSSTRRVRVEAGIPPREQSGAALGSIASVEEESADEWRRTHAGTEPLPK